MLHSAFCRRVSSVLGVALKELNQAADVVPASCLVLGACGLRDCVRCLDFCYLSRGLTLDEIRDNYALRMRNCLEQSSATENANTDRARVMIHV